LAKSDRGTVCVSVLFKGQAAVQLLRSLETDSLENNWSAACAAVSLGEAAKVL
jgi:hypothetical protein